MSFPAGALMSALYAGAIRPALAAKSQSFSRAVARADGSINRKYKAIAGFIRRHSGACRKREPAIHNYRLGLWIPGASVRTQVGYSRLGHKMPISRKPEIGAPE